MLLMHGLSYGLALTRNTKERASVCQSDQVGLRSPHVTTHTILTRTIFSSMSFIPNCRAEYITSFFLSVVPRIFLQNVHQLHFINRFSNLLAERLLCVCVFSSHPFWTSSSLDVPAGVTQEEGHTGFLIHLPSAVRALIFVVRRIQPFLSLVDREVEFCVLTN